MKPYRCIIGDDNELDRLTIKSYLSKIDDIEIVAVCSDPVEALKVVEMQDIDILFLDIDMQNISGIELLKKMKQIPICIFATDHLEFALKSFELETLDYLLKLFSYERFLQCINR